MENILKLMHDHLEIMVSVFITVAIIIYVGDINLGGVIILFLLDIYPAIFLVWFFKKIINFFLLAFDKVWKR